MAILTDLILQDCNLKDIKRAILRGANVNKIDKFGWSPLQTAITENKLDIFTFLIENGANVHHKDKIGRDISWYFFNKMQENINLFMN